MNYWVELTEKPQKKLDIKVFKPISVSNLLPSGMARGSTGCSEIVLDSTGSQTNKETKEGRVLGFLAQHQWFCGMLHSAQDT